MGRAEDLFRHLIEGGEAVVDEMIVERQTEELFLDFKRSSDSAGGTRLHDTDRSNLAKAISGFGNSEGGIVVWGVDCSRQPQVGDVASAKAPVQNPKRFRSWLEGAVSGCTIPPHPGVRHHAIESLGVEHGYVVTYVPKSLLVPHQCVRPPYYYLRAGSDFLPAPHGVLAGMFGRRRHAFVFHMWTVGLAKAKYEGRTVVAAEFDLGFVLGSHGPGMARDLYVNVKMLPPTGGSVFALSIPDQRNWTGHHAFGVLTNIVSVDGFKLAPGAQVQPLIFKASVIPNFERGLRYEISFGHGDTPMHKVEADVSVADLRDAWGKFVSNPTDTNIARQFVEDVMGLKSVDEGGLDLYGEP